MKKLTRCRVCESEDLTVYIDLGELPLSNNLCQTKEENPNRYPLQVMLCGDCNLSQLSVVIDPEVLFGHYVYRSSINQGYINHCRKMAKELKEEYNLTESSFMIDIAGNDGALLNEFKQEIGLKVLNIDPAANLHHHCLDKGIPMWCTFWGEKVANMILTRYSGSSKSSEVIQELDPRADLITATNVFAHVDNVREFLTAAKMVLKPDGVLILEFPYLIDFIDKNEFDTIYFEHLSYFSIFPLRRLCHRLGMFVTKVEKQDIHGGTVRVHIRLMGTIESSVYDFLDLEMNYRSLQTYEMFAEASKMAINEFKEGINDLKVQGFKVAGFAASAKGNTLLNCAGITDKDLMYIVDQTPEKIGKYSPGTGIEIVSMERLTTDPPDYLVILSWNFAQEIKDKCRAYGYTGKFIIPIPEFVING